MKLKYKLLIIIFFFLIIFIFNNNEVKANSSSYDLSTVYSESDYSSNLAYVIYEAEDNNIYFLKSEKYKFGYRSNYNHLITTKDYTANTYQEHFIYLLKDGTISLVVNGFKYQYLSNSDYYQYRVKNVLYSNFDIPVINDKTNIFFSANSLGDYSSFSNFSLSSLPELEIQQAESMYYPSEVSEYSYYLRTNFFDWNNRSNYYLYYSYNNTDNFIEYVQTRAVENFNYENPKFCMLFEVENYGTYYFKLYNSDTGEFSNTVTYDIQDNNILLGTHLVNSDILPIPELALLNKDNNVFVVSQWLSTTDYSVLSFYYRNLDNEHVKTEYLQNTDVIIEYSDYDNSLFRFKLPILYTGEYEFVFVRNTERSAPNTIYVDVFHLGDNEFSVTSVFNDTIPTLNLQDLDRFSHEQIFLYSQWFNSTEILYSIYYKDSDMEDFIKFTDYEIITNNEGQFRYKLRFTYDSTYNFRLCIEYDNTLVYGNMSSFVCTYFSSLSQFDIAKSKLFNLCENSFGFLFYPFTLMFSVFDRFLNINFNEPIINIPDLYVPLFENNGALISACSINFNEIIESKPVFKNIHNLILISSDAFIVLGLVSLFRKKWNEVFR